MIRTVTVNAAWPAPNETVAGARPATRIAIGSNTQSNVVFVPINGAVVRFPHRRPASPLPAALDPEQAALVGELLGAGTVVPMHYGGYDVEPWYRPVADAAQRFEAAARDRPYEARVLEPGGRLDLS